MSDANKTPDIADELTVDERGTDGQMADGQMAGGRGTDGQMADDLAVAIRGAYDAMGPTPDQEDRMLAALVEAQAGGSGGARRDGLVSGAPGDAQEDASGDAQDKLRAAASGSAQTAPAPAANKTRGFKVWKVALPLAACLVAGAVVVGISATGAPSAQTAQAPISTGEQNSSVAPQARTQSAEAGKPAATMKGDAGKGTFAMSESEAHEAGAVEDGYVEPATDFNTEEYDAVRESGFTSTKSNPLSTVSADVDTASYCNLRRMVNEGRSLSDIPAGAVRIEEMLNYFDYGYAEPSGGDKFSMQAQSAPCPWNPDTELLVLGFATGKETAAADKGSNLVFLVDVSGSMADADKLELLQDSFATLLENLGPNDRVSIVTYASGEEIVLEGAHGDDEAAILRAIYKLRAEGSTNGEAGLKQAYDVAERNFIPGGVNRIIMASDGDLNVGITSESDLYDFVDGKRETGVYLSVLGFGSGNYKDNKMETLADHGNGSYHYIDCIEEAERVLRDKLRANLVPFADDVKVQLEFNPAQVKAYRLIGYENRALADEDFRNDEVDAGDVGPNSQFTVAYELVLADSKMKVEEPDLKYGASSGATYGNASGDWLTCSLRYHAFDGDEMREQQLAVDATSQMPEPSDDWRMAAAVVEFGMLARDSEFAGTSSADSIVELLGGNLPDDRDAFKRLVAKAL